MAAADTIIRIIIVPVLVATLSFIAWVGVKLFDPISTTIGGPPASLGWTTNEHFYTFMALGLIGLILVVLVWLWVSPIREDVRQDVAGGRRF